MTASVRFLTFSALRMAVTWFFTVGSARSRARQIALLLFPCIIRARISTCRSVRPSSRGEPALAPAGGPGSGAGGGAAGFRRRRAPAEDFRRNVEAPRENEPQRAQHDFPGSRL